MALATHEDYKVAHLVPTFAVRLLTGPRAADAGSFPEIGSIDRRPASALSR